MEEYIIRYMYLAGDENICIGQQYTLCALKGYGLRIAWEFIKFLYFSVRGRYYLPYNKQNQRHRQKYVLIHCVLGRQSSIDWKMLALQPTKLGTDKKHKTKKKTWQESSNVCKVVNMRKNSNCQVYQDDDYKRN